MEEKAYIPSNLNIEKFLTENPPCFKYYVDCFRHIISLVTEIPSYNKDMLKMYNYALINSEKLQGKIHECADYLKYLVRHNIFETDNHYIPSEKSTGYRFTPQYRTSVKVELITKYTLVKSIRKTAPEEDKIVKKYSYMHRWYNEHLQIDFVGALKYLEQQLKLNIEKGDVNAMLKFNASFITITRISQHDFYFKVDPNVHRLHTPLTNIKSELRNFITYNGIPLVGVDFVNSQPCLSAVLLDENFYDFSATGVNSPFSFNIYNISDNLSNFQPLYSSSTIPDIYSYIMIVKYDGSFKGQGFQPYIAPTEKGWLYEYIQEAVEAETGIVIKDRKELKKIVFTVLFTDNRFIGQAEAKPKRIFRFIFPFVYEIFNLIKRKDSTILPRLLQTIESKLMLDNIAKRIAIERPDMPFFTIHDSIVCPVEDEGYAAEVMIDEMVKAIGIHPSVKPERWSSSNLA